MKVWRVWPVLVVGMSACDLDLSGLDTDCDVTEEWSDYLQVEGADRVHVVAAAGDLRVEGRADLSEVRVRAQACAAHRWDLDDIELVLQRTGSQVNVIGLVPGAGSGLGRLHLVVEVPDWMLIEIVDESGDIDLENVAGADVVDGSGDIRIEHVWGDVFVDDASGDVRILETAGDVWIADGSGDILVEDVLGDLTVQHDGSGAIRYRNVRGRVSLPR